MHYFWRSLFNFLELFQAIRLFADTSVSANLNLYFFIVLSFLYKYSQLLSDFNISCLYFWFILSTISITIHLGLNLLYSSTE